MSWFWLSFILSNYTEPEASNHGSIQNHQSPTPWNALRGAHPPGPSLPPKEGHNRNEGLQIMGPRPC